METERVPLRLNGLRSDQAEFVRSVQMLRATWQKTRKLTSEVLELTAEGFRAISFARVHVVGRAGRHRLQLSPASRFPLN